MTTARDESAAALRRDLATSRERLLNAIAGVSEEQFKRRPAPPTSPDAEQGWSIAEVLAHLLASERLRAERIEVALKQDGAAIAPLSPEAQREGARAGRVAPVPQLIHGLLASRRQLERLLDEAEALPDGLERGVTHPVNGRQTVRRMLREQVIDHEQEHVEQIEALKAGQLQASSFKQQGTRPGQGGETGRADR